jgi:hypothetical protein
VAITAGDAVESPVPQPGGATLEQRLDLVRVRCDSRVLAQIGVDRIPGISG